MKIKILCATTKTQHIDQKKKKRFQNWNTDLDSGTLKNRETFVSLLELVKSRNEPRIFTTARLKGTSIRLKDRKFNFVSVSNLFLKQLP